MSLRHRAHHTPSRLPDSWQFALNEEKYKLLRDGVPVKYRTTDQNGASHLVDKRLRLVDFDNPDNNRYKAVRELWVRGRLWLRRPDVIGYVNGLPLVFIELKRFEAHIDSAYKKNYSDYLDTIAHLFHWNALVMTRGKLQIDHWREKATAQAQVKAEIIKHLFAYLPPGAYDADEINLKADAVFVHLYTVGKVEVGQTLH